MKNKRGFASKKKVGKLRIPKPEEVGLMWVWLTSKVYDLLSPVVYVESEYCKEQRANELKNIVRKTYSNHRILNTAKAGFVPEDAEWVSYPLCLTKDDVGVPLETFLAYAKGRKYLTKSDAEAISDRAYIESSQIEDVCREIANFLRNKVCLMHETQDRTPEVRFYGALTNYYHVDASSGATVNIGR